MAARPLAIYGGGGFGREVLQLVRDINRREATWDCRGFIVDRALVKTPTIQGLPVLGDVSWLTDHPDVQVVIAIGSSADRRKVARRIAGGGRTQFATLVHPMAWVGDHVALGPGTVLCAGTLVTTDIRIGDHVHVNLGATVGHDAVLEDFVTVNPGVHISGNVTVSEGVELGTGSVIVPKCAIGAWSIVGAGSVVTKPLPADTTAVGAPARVIKERPAGWHDG
ncbi:MAG TPA: acetyltransferase [Candidatus Bathyarchaeia archaeon]|nr:acetyltransferase [Candidatus Bathyarchaeia archaeon]